MELRARIIRDLKSNFFRYFAVFCVIAIAMYVVVSMTGAAETVIKGVEKHAKVNRVEDGQFVLYVPLSSEEESSLKELGATIEEHFSMDFSINEARLRVFKSREKIDLLELDDGKMPTESNEIVLEKHFYEENSYKIGDTVTVGNVEFEIVGYGSTPDYDDVLQSLADASSNAERFGTSFVSEDGYQELLNSGEALNAEELLYAYTIDEEKEDELSDLLENLEFDVNEATDKYAVDYFNSFLEIKNEFSDGISDLVSGSKEVSDACKEMTDASSELNDTVSPLGRQFAQLANASSSLEDVSKEVKKAADDLNEGAKKLEESYKEFSDEYLDITFHNLKQHIKADDNSRVGASADDIQINKKGALIAGAIILILLAYVLSTFATNSIEQERKIIGTLYSLGFMKCELLTNYIVLPVMISTIGGCIGTLLGFLNMEGQISENSMYYSYPVFDNEYPVYLIVYGIIVPFLLSFLINFWLINKKLSQKPLELMRKSQGDYEGKGTNLGRMNFINKFRIKLFIRELKSNLTIAAGMFISLLLVMLAVTIYTATTTIVKETDEDIKFNYMYYLSYPEEESSYDAEQAYMEKLSKDRLNVSFDVSILGIEENSQAFPFDIDTKDGEVYISTSVANKYDLKVGDTIDLTDKVSNLTYNFKVKKIVSYAPGLFVFMDIESMRNRFDHEEDYYNVLLSDEKLDIDSGRIYSTITAGDLRYASEIFWTLMKKLVYMLIVSSVILFVLIMYLMVKMIIERQTNNISMFKLFGYTKREISKLYLRNNAYTVLVSTAIFIPITKWIIVQIYPFLTSNRAVGFNLSFSLEIYIFLVGVIFVSYLIAYILSVLKLNKVDIQEVLKERE
ncbi:MAG: hypothetical protein K2N61_12745 [Lachnospiraceae bacterium]|nr:hypothetical protein [Lachnospiraceae bacterium]